MHGASWRGWTPPLFIGGVQALRLTYMGRSEKLYASSGRTSLRKSTGQFITGKRRDSNVLSRGYPSTVRPRFGMNYLLR